MWLHLDRAADVRVELLAVDAADAWVDHSTLLRSWDPPFVTRAALAIVRDERLPIDSRVVVAVDSEDEADAPLWGVADSRAGFGGLHGIGEFGRDHATAPGSGLGEFGIGAMGGEGAAWRWRRDDLPAGDHELSMRVLDHTGATAGQVETPTSISLDGLPASARNVKIDQAFNLTWEA